MYEGGAGGEVAVPLHAAAVIFQLPVLSVAMHRATTSSWVYACTGAAMAG